MKYYSYDYNLLKKWRSQARLQDKREKEEEELKLFIAGKHPLNAYEKELKRRKL